MAKKKTYAEMSREERVTGVAPVDALDTESREYRVTHPVKEKTHGSDD